MKIHRCHVSRPDPSSSFRICEASGLSLQVLACEWSDLDDLRAWLRARDAAAAYVLVGQQGAVQVAYVGEGCHLWERLPRHRCVLQPIQRIFVVCCEGEYEKGATVFFQEGLSDRLKACGRLPRIGASPCRLKIPLSRRQELEWQVEAAVELLSLAGCEGFVPHRGLALADGSAS